MKNKILILSLLGMVGLATSCRKQPCPAYGKIHTNKIEKRTT